MGCIRARAMCCGKLSRARSLSLSLSLSLLLSLEQGIQQHLQTHRSSCGYNERTLTCFSQTLLPGAADRIHHRMGHRCSTAKRQAMRSVGQVNLQEDERSSRVASDRDQHHDLSRYRLGFSRTGTTMHAPWCYWRRMQWLPASRRYGARLIPCQRGAALHECSLPQNHSRHAPIVLSLTALDVVPSLLPLEGWLVHTHTHYPTAVGCLLGTCAGSKLHLPGYPAHTRHRCMHSHTCPLADKDDDVQIGLPAVGLAQGAASEPRLGAPHPSLAPTSRRMAMKGVVSCALLDESLAVRSHAPSLHLVRAPNNER